MCRLKGGHLLTGIKRVIGIVKVHRVAYVSFNLIARFVVSFLKYNKIFESWSSFTALLINILLQNRQETNILHGIYCIF